MPPTVIFDPTLENFSLIQERTDYTKFAWNSIITSVGGTALALAIAVPAAYAMAFFPGRRTKDILLWMLSTKMLPAVGVLMPIYLISQKLGLLDTRIVLVVIYAMINLPIVIWLLFTYFREIPKEILEASRMDGTSTFNEIVEIVIPLSWGGVVSTALLSIVLLWNEAFWSINLTSSDAGTLTASGGVLFQSGGPVLVQAFGGFDGRMCSDRRSRLVLPETTGSGPDVRGGQMRSSGVARIDLGDRGSASAGADSPVSSSSGPPLRPMTGPAA